MSPPQGLEVLVLASGEGGKYLAWHLAQSGRRAAGVERKWIGGFCPNINCLPSKTALRDAILTHPTMAEGLNMLFAATLSVEQRSRI